MVSVRFVAVVSVIVTLGYFMLKAYLEPYLDQLNLYLDNRREAKLTQELIRLAETDKLLDAKLATQVQRDLVEEKKRLLNSN